MKSLMPQIDSNDGLFHNGNPATGEQGTRVTDTWLNNLQDRVRDVQAEAHYVLQKAGFRPVENKQTQLYEAIVKIIDDNRKTASLTQKGETKLYTGYDSQSEDLASTPKTAYQLKQLIDSNTRALGNVIPNSKKSSAVNSNSADTVATSAAVKTAYDKAAEAKETADAKQSPATTLAGYGIGNFKIEPFVGNVNSLQTDGIYAVTQASRSQNLPVAGNGCHIQVIAGGDGRWCRQIAYIAYSTDMYERHQTSYQTDSWSAWVKLNDIEPVRQLVAQKANLADFSYQKIGNFEIRKYPDGTMIQSYLIEQYDLNVWQEKSFNWAQAFISTPMIFSKITTSISGPHDCDVNILTKSNNRTCYYHEYEHGTSDQGNVRIEFLAMGRWK